MIGPLFDAADLPAHWSSKRLRFVTSINREQLTADTPPEEPLRYMDISSVGGDGSLQEPQTMLFADAPSRARRLARQGDTAVSTVRTYLKAIAFVDRGHSDCVWSTGFAILSPGPELDPKFLYYVTRSNPFLAEIERRSVGVGYPAVNADDVADIACPVPPRDEQRRIVDFLEAENKRIGDLAALGERMLDLLAERDRAAVVEALERLSAPARSLGQITDFVGGTGFPHRFQGLSSGDLPFVKVSDLHRPGSDVYIDDAENWISDDVSKELGARIIPEGAVIFPKIGAAMLKNPRRLTGRSCVVDNNILAIVPRMISSRYLRYALLTVDFAQFANPGPVPSLDTSAVASLKVKLPGRQEQEAVADRLDGKLRCHRRLRAAIKAQANLLGERRNALITAAVTGELDPSFYRGSAVAA